MKGYFRYMLLLTLCILLTGCSKESEDFTAVSDTAEVHETQPAKTEYWQKQLDVNGTNVAQIIINARIGEIRTDSLYEVSLNRRNLDAQYAEETAEKLFDSYEKGDALQEEGILFTGLWDNQPCKFEVYGANAYFSLSNYRNGLYHCPEGEWAGAVPATAYIAEENSSEISREEAEQIAAGFLEKLGLASYRLARIEDLYWEPLEQSEEEEVKVRIAGVTPVNTWCEGYALTYARDIKGIMQDVEGYWYTTVQAQMRLGDEYNRNLEEITLYVTDFGVVDARASQLCNAKEHSLEGQQVILLHAISGEEIDPKTDAFSPYSEEQYYEIKPEKVPEL